MFFFLGKKEISLNKIKEQQQIEGTKRSKETSLLFMVHTYGFHLSFSVCLFILVRLYQLSLFSIISLVTYLVHV